MTLDTFVNIPGNLRDAYKQAVSGTLRHVDELMNERRTNSVTPDGNLRNQWFYTADGEIYFMDGKTPMLAITREPDNLVLRHIDDAFTQLTTTGNYRPEVVEAQTAIKSATTLVVDLTKLKLQGKEDEFRYMAISTSKYDKLTPEQRVFAQRVYGQDADFAANMQMFKDAKIDETNIFVLNPDYVREHAGKVPLARASWLYLFGNGSGFGAYGRSIDGHNRARGVRWEASEASRVSPEGRALESEVSPPAPVAASEIKFPTINEVLAISRQYVSAHSWRAFETDLGKLYKP